MTRTPDRKGPYPEKLSDSHHNANREESLRVENRVARALEGVAAMVFIVLVIVALVTLLLIYMRAHVHPLLVQ